MKEEVFLKEFEKLKESLYARNPEYCWDFLLEKWNEELEKRIFLEKVLNTISDLVCLLKEKSRED